MRVRRIADPNPNSDSGPGPNPEHRLAGVDVDGIDAARLDGEHVKVAEGLEVVAAIARVVREAREESGEQRGDGGLGCAQREPPSAKEKEADSHADGHMESVGHLRGEGQGLGQGQR